MIGKNNNKKNKEKKRKRGRKKRDKKQRRRKRRKAIKSILSYPGWFPVSVIITHPTARSFGLQLPSPIMALAATEAY